MVLGLSPKSLIERNKANQKRWREHNPERVKELQKKHNSRPEVIEKKRIWAARNRNNIRKEHNNIFQVTTTNVEYFFEQKKYVKATLFVKGSICKSFLENDDNNI